METKTNRSFAGSTTEKEHKEDGGDISSAVAVARMSAGTRSDGDAADAATAASGGSTRAREADRILQAARRSASAGADPYRSASIPTRPKQQQQQQQQRVNLVSVLLGRCTGMCATFPAAAAECRGGMMQSPCAPGMPFSSSSSRQFVELQGLQFIGLGALVDELTPRERVYDTIEQVKTRTERLVSIGYILDEEDHRLCSSAHKTETVPLDVWNKNTGTDDDGGGDNMKKYANDATSYRGLSKPVQTIVELTTVRFLFSVVPSASVVRRTGLLSN